MDSATLFEHKRKLGDLWAKQEKRKHQLMTVDWRNLEQDIRSVLKDVKDGNIDSTQGLIFIDDYVAYHTLRGRELKGT